LCSEADAFIAATFVDSFSPGSILGFLLLGPMIDLKNTFMLFSTFKPGFVIILMIIILVNVFTVATVINLFS
ncbi:MAG: permease, partial [Firmicutes bacterium]|nr:permease [Bacillota bacterium]